VTNLITPQALFSTTFLQSCSHGRLMDKITYSRNRPIFIWNFPRWREAASWIWFNRK